MTVYLVPLVPSQQYFNITLAGVTYTMRLIYCDDPSEGWILDIGDVNGNPILCGTSLKSGVNLLHQYEYLNFGGGLAVVLGGDITSVGYTDLGVNAQLYFVTS